MLNYTTTITQCNIFTFYMQCWRNNSQYIMIPTSSQRKIFMILRRGTTTTLPHTNKFYVYRSFTPKCYCIFFFTSSPLFFPPSQQCFSFSLRQFFIPSPFQVRSFTLPIFLFKKINFNMRVMHVSVSTLPTALV